MGDRLIISEAWETDVVPAYEVYKEKSKAIGDVVEEQCKLVTDCFNHLGSQLNKVVTMDKPANKEAEGDFHKDMPGYVNAVLKHRDDHRSHEYYMHLSTVSEGVVALTWMSWAAQDIAKTIRSYKDASAYFGNRVIVKYKASDRSHVEWANSWLDFLSHLAEYTKAHHTKGLNWKTTQDSGAGKIPPPPLPPPEEFMSGSNMSKNVEMLLKDLNVGESITKGLKHVSPKKKGPPPTPENKASDVISKSPSPYKSVQGKPDPGKSLQGPPRYELIGKKWLIEYKKDCEINVEPQCSQTIYAYRCKNIFIEVSNKVLGVTLDGCEDVRLSLHGVVSFLDIINCKKAIAQAFGTMPTLTVSGCDNAQVYLSNNCLDCEIFTEKSTGVNIMVPNKEDTDFTEHFIPEQFLSVVRDRVLETTAVIKN